MSGALETAQSGMGVVEQGFSKFGLPVLLGGSALWSALSCFKTISEGEAGIRTRRGNALRKDGSMNRVYGPGLVKKFPGLGDFDVINTTKRSDQIPRKEFDVPLIIDRKDRQYSVAASVIWRVKYESRDKEGKKYGKNNPYDQNVYKAIYESRSSGGDALTRVVVDGHCRSGIRQVMESLQENKFRNDHEIQGGVKEIVDDVLIDQYGVELLHVLIGNVALTGADKIEKAISALGTNGGDRYDSPMKAGVVVGALGVAAEELHSIPELMILRDSQAGE
ncbi:MAG: hypothetical protein NVSMB46_04070 [Candidatus Saccharimonadales bacterium]